MAMNRLSIKNKILVVLTTVPIFAITLVVVIASSTFRNDKITYVFSALLTSSQAKSSSANSQIFSLVQSLKGITVNYDPKFKKMSSNGQKFFEAEESLKGFAHYRWTGESFENQFQSFKEESKTLDIKENDGLKNLMLEATHFKVAVGTDPLYPFHIVLAVKLGEGHDVALLIAEKTDFFSLFGENGGASNFLVHKSRGVVAGTDLIGEVRSHLYDKVFTKEINETTFEVGSQESPYLASLSSVSLGDLYVLSIVKRNAALKAVDTMMYRALLFTGALLSFLLIVGVFAANRLTRPLRMLNRATSKVMKGDFSVKVEAKNKDEIGSLATSFNKMTDEVARLMEKTAENARMEAELKTAHTVQETLFPAPVAQLGPISLVGKSEPASECGGDWWYYNQCGDLVYIWIGDATGHGAPAALLTSAIRAVASVVEGISGIRPSEAMKIMNKAIHATSKGQMMMTFFLGCFDISKGTLTYCNASHDPPLYLSNDVEGKPKRKNYFPLVEANNPRLGENSASEYTEYEMNVGLGDKFIFYTDGILDVKNQEGNFWGERRFIKSLSVINETEKDSLVETIFSDMNAYREEVPLDDDVTLVVLEYNRDTIENRVAS